MGIVILIVLAWLISPIVLGIICIVQKSRIKQLERENERLGIAYSRAKNVSDQNSFPAVPPSSAQDRPAAGYTGYHPYNYGQPVNGRTAPNAPAAPAPSSNYSAPAARTPEAKGGFEPDSNLGERRSAFSSYDYAKTERRDLNASGSYGTDRADRNAPSVFPGYNYSRPKTHYSPASVDLNKTPAAQSGAAVPHTAPVPPAQNAGQEIKPEVKAEKAVAAEVKPEVKAENIAAAEVKPEVKTENVAAVEVKPEVKAENIAAAEVKPEVKTVNIAAAEVKPEVKTENIAAAEVRAENISSAARSAQTMHAPIAPAPVSADRSYYSAYDPKPAGTEPKAPKKNQGPSAINVILILGALFVTLSGFVFAAASWGVLNTFFKSVLLLSFSAVFFLIHWAAEKKLKLDVTGKVFYGLGSAFLPAAAAAAGILRVFGDYFSFYGEGRLLVTALMAALLSGCLFKGAAGYKSKSCARVAYGALTLAVSAVMIHIGSTPAASALMLSLYAFVTMLIEPAVTKKAGENVILREYKYFTSGNIWILAVISLFLSQGGTLFVIPTAVFSAAFFISAMRSSSASSGTFACAAYLLAGAYLGIRPDSFDGIILVAALVMVVYTSLSMLGVIPEEMRKLTAAIRTVASAAIIAAGLIGSARSAYMQFEPAVLIAAAAVFAQLLVVTLRSRDVYGKFAVCGSFIWLAFESAKGLGEISGFDFERAVFAGAVLLFFVVIKLSPAKKVLYHKSADFMIFAVAFADIFVCKNSPEGLIVWFICLITAFVSWDDFGKFLAPAAMLALFYPLLIAVSPELTAVIFASSVFAYFAVVKLTGLKKVFYGRAADIIAFAVLFISNAAYMGYDDMPIGGAAIWAMLTAAAFISGKNFGKYLAPIAVLWVFYPAMAFLELSGTAILFSAVVLVYLVMTKFTGLKKIFYGKALDIVGFAVLLVTVFAYRYSEFAAGGLIVWAICLMAAFVSWDNFGKILVPAAVLSLYYPLWEIPLTGAAQFFGLERIPRFGIEACIFAGAVLAYFAAVKLSRLKKVFYGKALDILSFAVLAFGVFSYRYPDGLEWCGLVIWAMCLGAAFVSWDNFGKFLAPGAMLILWFPLGMIPGFRLEAVVFAAAVLVYFAAARLTGLSRSFYGKVLDIVCFVPIALCIFAFGYPDGYEPWGIAVWVMCLGAAFISWDNFGKFLAPAATLMLYYPLTELPGFRLEEAVFAAAVLVYFAAVKLTGLKKVFYGRALDIVCFVPMMLCITAYDYPDGFRYLGLVIWAMCLGAAFISWKEFGKILAPIAVLSLLYPLSEFPAFRLDEPVFAAVILIYLVVVKFSGLKKIFYGKWLDIVCFVPVLMCVFRFVGYMSHLELWGLVIWAICFAAALISWDNFGKFLAPIAVLALYYPLSELSGIHFESVIFAAAVFGYFAAAKMSPLKKIFYGRALDVAAAGALFFAMTDSDYSHAPLCGGIVWLLLCAEAFISGKDFAFGRAAAPVAVASLVIPLYMTMEHGFAVNGSFSDAVIVTTLIYCITAAVVFIRPLRRYSDSFSLGIPVILLIYVTVMTDFLNMSPEIVMPLAVTVYSGIRLTSAKSRGSYPAHWYFFLSSLCFSSFEIGRLCTDNENAFVFPAAVLILLFGAYIIPVGKKGKSFDIIGAFVTKVSAVYGALIALISAYEHCTALFVGAWALAAVTSAMSVIRKKTKTVYIQTALMHICTYMFVMEYSETAANISVCAAAAVCGLAGRLIFKKKVFADLRSEPSDHLTLTGFAASVVLFLNMSSYSIWCGFLITTLLILCLVRSENPRRLNVGLFTAASVLIMPLWWSQPFLTIPELLETESFLLPVALACILLKLIHKDRHYKDSDLLSFAAAIVSFAWLFFDAARTEHPLDAVILGVVIMSTLIAAFITHRKNWFILGTVSAVAAALLLTVKLWNSRLWWLYLLIAGVLLIIIGMTNEINKQKRRNGERTKFDRFMSEWWLEEEAPEHTNSKRG